MKVSPFGKSETKTKGKSGSINRPVLDYDWYGECTRSTHPSVSSNGKVFTGMAGFVWNDATRRRGSNGTLNEIRVCSSFVIVPPLARINFSKNFSSSLIFARSFSESFIRFRFGINSLFIHILYFRIFVPPCVVVFVLFTFWFLILYFAILFRFILYSFILCFIWFVNKKKLNLKIKGSLSTFFFFFKKYSETSNLI